MYSNLFKGDDDELNQIRNIYHCEPDKDFYIFSICF